MKYSKAMRGKMIFPKHIPENQRPRHCNPRSPQTHPGSASFHFLQLVPWDACHWHPSDVFRVLTGPLPRKAHRTVSEPQEDFGVCSAAVVSSGRSEHKHRLYVGVDVLSVSALNVRRSKREMNGDCLNHAGAETKRLTEVTGPREGFSFALFTPMIHGQTSGPVTYCLLADPVPSLPPPLRLLHAPSKTPVSELWKPLRQWVPAPMVTVTPLLRILASHPFRHLCQLSVIKNF